MKWLDELNPAQREAAEALSGPVIVLAGAGSGKTKMLTTRIVHLIHNGVHPSCILSLTILFKLYGCKTYCELATPLRQSYMELLFVSDFPCPFVIR